MLFMLKIQCVSCKASRSPGGTLGPSRTPFNIRYIHKCFVSGQSYEGGSKKVWGGDLQQTARDPHAQPMQPPTIFTNHVRFPWNSNCLVKRISVIEIRLRSTNPILTTDQLCRRLPQFAMNLALPRICELAAACSVSFGKR
jgi:hypothetical protein